MPSQLLTTTLVKVLQRAKSAAEKHAETEATVQEHNLRASKMHGSAEPSSFTMDAIQDAKKAIDIFLTQNGADITEQTAGTK